jgi:hypothetical protein
MRILFEQDDPRPGFGGADGGAEPGGPGADDDKRESLRGIYFFKTQIALRDMNKRSASRRR